MLKLYLSNISDSIRSKLGITDVINAQKFPDKIEEVYNKGSADGWKEFQNALTGNGERKSYYRAFYEADFTKKRFDPIIYPTNIGYAFLRYKGKEMPSGFDCSKAEYDETTTDHSIIPVLFAGHCLNLEHFPDMGIKPCGNISSMFIECTNLKTIEILRVLDITTYPSTFSYCKSLEYIRFEGTIGTSISFSYSPLDVESMKDIITHLKNYTGTENEGTYTLTLKDECKTILQEDTQTVELGGEVYTYFELIAAKGWNLA